MFLVCSFTPQHRARLKCFGGHIWHAYLALLGSMIGTAANFLVVRDSWKYGLLVFPHIIPAIYIGDSCVSALSNDNEIKYSFFKITAVRNPRILLTKDDLQVDSLEQLRKKRLLTKILWHSFNFFNLNYLKVIKTISLKTTVFIPLIGKKRRLWYWHRGLY